MARKHRKLFPSSNQNKNCQKFGNSVCPDNCNTFVNSGPVPPLYPPPPPPDESNHSFINSIYFIFLVSFVAGVFLLLSYYVIIVKPFAPFRRRRSRNNQTAAEQPGEEFQDDYLIVHPVWLIATVGLQQSVINSITICRYKSGEGLIEGTECSVCLSEFQENEMLRLLPKCSHAFHIPCIDTWLRSHTNCPLCRAPIVSDRTPNNSSGSIGQNSEDLNPNGVDLVENVEFDENDETRIVDTGEPNSVQDEDPRVSKEVKISYEYGSDTHQLQKSGSMKSRLSDAVFISLPYVYTDSFEGSSANVLFNNAQEHNLSVIAEGKREHAVFRRTASFSDVNSVSERAESIKRSFSYSGTLFHNHRT